MKNEQTIRAGIIEIAMETIGSASLYREVHLNAEQEEHLDNHGSVTIDGHEVHLLAQTQQDSIYGYEVSDASEANYLVADDLGPTPAPDVAVIVRVLDVLFGSMDDWPDNYAQTCGWDVKING